MADTTAFVPTPPWVDLWFLRIDRATWGSICLIPGVWRECDRSEFVILTNRRTTMTNVRHGDIVIRFGKSVTVLRLSDWWVANG